MLKRLLEKQGSVLEVLKYAKKQLNSSGTFLIITVHHAEN